MASPGEADRRSDKQPGVPGPGEHTPVTSINPVAPPGTIIDDRRAIRVGGLVGTNVGNLDQTPHRGDGSTILPNDTPYQLVRRLGSGAFGEVFEALAPGGVRVAVKRITRSVDHPASRSEKEALDSIKGLSHPFLLKTSAYWVFDDRLVIVMELADGSLADRVAFHQSQGRIGAPPEELIPLFEQSGEALDYLHSQNVSHRDVKPENILVMQGYAKVADFGLARLHEHALTVVQNTVGTPAYMAPEMWKHKVSLQSDQYSLAATYVKCRLGRHLFTTDVLVDMANFHIHETPNLDPLSTAEQAVLLKALAKKPEDRYPTCLAFARALRAAVFPPPPPPPPPPAPEPPAREGRRTAWGTVAVVIACAVTVGVVNWATQSRDQAKDKPSDKEKETEKEKDKEKPVVPQKRFAVYPKGWEPVDKNDVRVIGDRHYHNRLTRTVSGNSGTETLVAILVFPVRANDPSAFYMFQNKVTNRVFDAVWGQMEKSPEFEGMSTGLKTLLRSPQWLSGAKDSNGKYLNVESEQAGVPVVGVTLPQAIWVANQLGGLVPNAPQWKKAVGALGDDPRPGPAGEALPPLPPGLKTPGERYLARQKQLAAREAKLALGLENGLWPVDRLTGDVSYCGIHQLVTNGQEWLTEDSEGKQYDLANLGPGPKNAKVAGEAHNSVNVVTFKSFDFRVQDWDAVDPDSAAGFRVVFKPQ